MFFVGMIAGILYYSSDNLFIGFGDKSYLACYSSIDEIKAEYPDIEEF